MEKRMRDLIGSGRCAVDLGCGSGQLLNDIEDAFDERIGLDISMQRLEQIKSKNHRSDFSFQLADLNKAFPLSDESVDAVVANQVIEHVVDPLHFAKEIHRVLREPGRCVITTPNVRYLKHVARLLFSGFGPRTSCGCKIDGAWDDGHLHYFTHRDLSEIFTEAGFQVIESKAFIDLSQPSQARKILDRYASRPLVREFLSGNILFFAQK